MVDGLDLRPVLFGKGPSPRDTVFYYRGVRLYAVRKGPYKAHFITQSGYGKDKPVEHDPPLLYHLASDPSEQYDLAKNRPEVIAAIRKVVEQHRSELVPGEDQLSGRIKNP